MYLSIKPVSVINPLSEEFNRRLGAIALFSGHVQVVHKDNHTFSGWRSVNALATSKKRPKISTKNCKDWHETDILPTTAVENPKQKECKYACTSKWQNWGWKNRHLPVQLRENHVLSLASACLRWKVHVTNGKLFFRQVAQVRFRNNGLARASWPHEKQWLVLIQQFVQKILLSAGVYGVDDGVIELQHKPKNSYFTH